MVRRIAALALVAVVHSGVGAVLFAAQSTRIRIHSGPAPVPGVEFVFVGFVPSC
jgi:O-succinylbenzoate synthase